MKVDPNHQKPVCNPSVHCSRVNVALLSVLMYVTEVYGDRHQARLAFFQKVFAGTGCLVPLVLVIVIALGGRHNHHHHVSERSHQGEIDPFFQYGQLQVRNQTNL